MFFTMLTSISEGDEVDLSTFIMGCLRMKGLATSIDLHTLSFEMKMLWSQCRSSLDRLEECVFEMCQTPNQNGSKLQCPLSLGLDATKSGQRSSPPASDSEFGPEDTSVFNGTYTHS